MTARDKKLGRWNEGRIYLRQVWIYFGLKAHVQQSVSKWPKVLKQKRAAPPLDFSLCEAKIPNMGLLRQVKKVELCV